MKLLKFCGTSDGVFIILIGRPVVSNSLQTRPVSHLSLPISCVITLFFRTPHKPRAPVWTSMEESPVSSVRHHVPPNMSFQIAEDASGSCCTTCLTHIPRYSMHIYVVTSWSPTLEGNRFAPPPGHKNHWICLPSNVRLLLPGPDFAQVPSSQVVCTP